MMKEALAGRFNALAGATLEKLQAVEAVMHRKTRTDKDYMSRAKKRQCMVAPTEVSITDCKIYVAPGLQATLPGFDAVKAQARLAVANVDEASAFIVKDISKPSTAVLWAAMLIGGTICTWQIVKSGFGPSR